VPFPTCFLSGCLGLSRPTEQLKELFTGKPKPPAGPADILVLRGEELETEKGGDEKDKAELEGAKELYRRGEYAKAEPIFRRVAENTKNSTAIAEEARYYQADCLRLQSYYTQAAEAYNKVLNDFRYGLHREQAKQRMFDIAFYWLDDTRKEMEAEKEKKEGKRWLVMPTSFVHFERSKPLLDEEGRALELLEQVRLADINGPYAEKALYYCGSVRFYREDYADAEQYFTQLVTMHPNSPYAEKALKLAIVCKQLGTGGSAYDGRKLVEARQLVDMALRNYPQLARKEHDFLERQIISINLQQADKDYNVAEFYQRIGKLAPAYFQYEIVRRRYPGTKYYDQATKRMQELRARLDQEQAKNLPPPSGPRTPPSNNAALQSEQAPGPRPTAPTPQPPAQTPSAPRPLPPELTGTR
jgi:TolA-binding protein